MSTEPQAPAPGPTATGVPLWDPSSPPGPRQGALAAPAKAPGVKDVARLAGVSVGTVSNVLNGRDSVRAAIRERVEAAIDELGYVPNPTAQALRTGMRPLVGVAVLDISNPFFMEAAAGVERRLDQAGCVMALSSTRSDVDEEARVLRTLAGQGVRGILLTPTDPQLAVAHEVVSRGTQVVLFDFPGGPQDMSSVSMDDRAGARLALTHLLDLGHRTIVFLDGPHHVRQARDRAAGAHQAVDAFDQPVSLRMVELDAFNASAGREGMRALLAGARVRAFTGTNGVDASGMPLAPPSLPRDFPTAVFCANDLIAFGAMTALRDSGVRIPQDVSLIGFDDISVASQMSVPLTTVRQPMAELGWAAADLLLGEHTGIQHQSFFPDLVVRNSTGVPRKGAAAPRIPARATTTTKGPAS